ncbi:hypothetical protein NEAUS05_1429 [Nematocida ausubeli]|nr:hypothetical protein NEAUS05_1429 [Nematocida ausubeli]
MNMKDKIQEYLHKRNNGQISIKILVEVLLISIFLAGHAFALIKRNEILDIQKEIIRTNEGVEYLVNPSGPLSPIMLYLCRKVDILHKKRFNSDYIVKHGFCPLDLTGTVRLVFDRSSDTVSKNYIEDDEPKNVENRYNALINMFPSPDGEISIYPKDNCKDSFTLFLQSDSIKVYSHRILIALLLLSEGIDVPLKFKKYFLNYPTLQWKSPSQREIFLSVKMIISSEGTRDRYSSKRKAHYQRTTEQIIHTFTEFHAESQFETEKTTFNKEYSYEDWDNENKLDLRWLIQSYIYFYLETKNEVIKFNLEVFRIVDSYIKECERFSLQDQKIIALKFFNRCFMDKNTESDVLDSWEKVNKFEEILTAQEQIQLLPFTENSQLPIKTKGKIHLYGLAQLKKEIFSPDIESALLGLFCCFAYDPDTNTYNIDHIPFMSEEVKGLFAMESDDLTDILNESCEIKEKSVEKKSVDGKTLKRRSLVPGEKIPEEIYKRWKEILEEISSTYLNYNEFSENFAEENNYIELDRSSDLDISSDQGIDVNSSDSLNSDGYFNENSSSYENSSLDGYGVIESDRILEILTVILKLTGRYKVQEKKKIDRFRIWVKSGALSSGISSTDSFAEKVEEYAAELFASLSRNCKSSKSLVDWYKSPSDEETRKVFVRLSRLISNEDSYNGLNIYNGIEVYYAYKRQAHNITLHLWNDEMGHLQLGKPIIKIDRKNQEMKTLKSEIFEIKKNTFPEYTLYKYASSIGLYITDCIIIDYYIEEDKGTERISELFDLIMGKDVCYATKFDITRYKEVEIFNNPEYMYKYPCTLQT